ncbi:hypothetical protein [Anaerosolibacter sp.]|uniref:hypothetical protein n=1 Tax=Anaerosolibacter sp. TaxID=1872527 RepID=UPI0039EEFE00
MGRGNIIAVNPEKIALTDIVRTGRQKAMSFLNVNLDIRHFHIDISVKKDEEKRKERVRRIIEQEQRINQIVEERNKLNWQVMRITM